MYYYLDIAHSNRKDKDKQMPMERKLNKNEVRWSNRSVERKVGSRSHTFTASKKDGKFSILGLSFHVELEWAGNGYIFLSRRFASTWGTELMQESPVGEGVAKKVRVGQTNFCLLCATWSCSRPITHLQRHKSSWGPRRYAWTKFLKPAAPTH